jgi:hypothetical protein
MAGFENSSGLFFLIANRKERDRFRLRLVLNHRSVRAFIGDVIAGCAPGFLPKRNGPSAGRVWGPSS